MKTEKKYNKLSFHGVKSDFIKSCFKEAYDGFPELRGNNLRFEKLPLKGYTMRAQPVLNWSVFGRSTRHYRVQMSNHVKIAEHVRPAELPRDVLVGWFAHELGHVVDYHRMSLLSLIWFIIGYVLFSTHRIGAERRADVFALDKDFGKELMATKVYILDKSSLPDKYKKRIRKYYMSPDELELLINDREAERVLF